MTLIESQYSGDGLGILATAFQAYRGFPAKRKIGSVDTRVRPEEGNTTPYSATLILLELLGQSLLIPHHYLFRKTHSYVGV